MKVTSICRSLINKDHWVLSLSCGHSVRIMSKRRPSEKYLGCTICFAAELSLDH